MREPKYKQGQVLRLPLQPLVPIGRNSRNAAPGHDKSAFHDLVEIIHYNKDTAMYSVYVITEDGDTVLTRIEVHDIPAEFLESQCSVDVIRSMKGLKDEK